MSLPDPTILQRQASDPQASVWVAASAGSGKTKVLTDRVLRLLLAGTPPERLLCLTFTRAAAAEMAVRIHRRLSHWAIAAEAELADDLAKLSGERPDGALMRAARRLFARVIDCPGGMKLQTIHAFCQSVLRRFPLEARVAPHFEVMDEATAAERLEEASHSLLEAARQAPQGVLGRALARLTTELHEDSFRAVVGEVVRERARLRRLLDAHNGLPGLLDALYRHLDATPGEEPEDLLARACTEETLDGHGLRVAARGLAEGSVTDQARGATLAAWLAADLATRQATFEDWRLALLTKEDEPRKTLATKAVTKAHPGIRETLEAEAERLVRVQARRKNAATASATAALLAWGEALLQAWRDLKAARALLDYDDLVLGVRDLLSQPGMAEWVLFKLDGGIDHLLIDEAQDTNPEQWEVVASLTEEFFAGRGARAEQGVVRTLFAVGDEKQSIYSFQRADPAEFLRLRRVFQERIQAAAQGWREVALQVSFRSTAAVLEAVDGVFAGAVAGDGVVFSPETPLRHHAFRRGEGGLVEVWPQVAPAEPPEITPWTPPVERHETDSPPARLAAALAATIAGWLARGERLPARKAPIRPGDILVLVRQRSGFVVELVRALKARNVPVAGVDRMVLVDQLAVMDLCALAQVLLLPGDDLSLAVVLKSPLLGLSEDDLFTLAWERPGTLWQALTLRADENPAWREVADYLEGLRREAGFRPPYEFFSSVLRRPCPAHGGSGLMAVLSRLGNEARDPLDEFLSACLQFQRTHRPSLQGFLHWLEGSRTEIKREHDPEGGPPGGVVRIMTVHGAKGLQAPVVILPDTLAPPRQRNRILWPDRADGVPLWVPRKGLEGPEAAAMAASATQRRDQEYRRLLYVALTRAEDRLLVCGWRLRGEPPAGGWYRLVTEGLTALPEVLSFPFTAPAGTAPAGGGWTGAALRLTSPQTAAARTIHKEDEGPALPLAPLPPWAMAPPPPEPEPSRPLAPSRPDDPEPALRSPLGEDDGQHFRRGLLLHRLFQTLPDLPETTRAEAARHWLARPIHGLTPAQQKDILTETLAVLHHPGFAPLFGPGSQAEVPVVGLVGGRALAGQIDRLRVDAHEVWIVDYKTNRPPPRHESQVAPLYLRQLAAYRAALAALYPTHRIRGFLLWTDGPHLMEIPTETLDAYGPEGSVDGLLPGNREGRGLPQRQG